MKTFDVVSHVTTSFVEPDISDLVAVLQPGDVLVTAENIFVVVTGRVVCYTDGGYRATGKLMVITSDQANDMHEYEGAKVFETTMGFVGLWRQA